MRLRMLVIAFVFAAGLGASYALADDGHGHGDGNGDIGSHCGEVNVRGTVAPQTFTVTVTKGSRRLNLAPGSTVVVTVGGSGQTVSFDGEGCSTTTGSTTSVQVKEAKLHARTPHQEPTTTGATTGGTTTSH